MSYISQMDVNTYISFNDHSLNNIKMKIKNMVKKCKKNLYYNMYKLYVCKTMLINII